MKPKKLIIAGNIKTSMTFIVNFLNSQNRFYIYKDFNNSISQNKQALKALARDTLQVETQNDILLSNLYTVYGTPSFISWKIKSNDVLFNLKNYLVYVSKNILSL